MLSSTTTPTFVVVVVFFVFVVVAVCGRCWRAFDARENDDDVSRDDTIVVVVVDDDVVFFRRSPGKRTTPLPTPKDVYDDEKNANWWRGRNGKTRRKDDEDENLERVGRVFVVVDIGRRGRGRHEDDEDDDDEGECRTTFDGKATVE